jgi:lipopolysaccharide biosynthesis glycosyltransferase
VETTSSKSNKSVSQQNCKKFGPIFIIHFFTKKKVWIMFINRMEFQNQFYSGSLAQEPIWRLFWPLMPWEMDRTDVWRGHYSTFFYDFNFFPTLSYLSKFIKILLEHENVILACKIQFQQNFGVNSIGLQDWPASKIWSLFPKLSSV